ncbi:hypothetical protein GCM10028791_38540 [Echinicola sediminis]
MPSCDSKAQYPINEPGTYQVLSDRVVQGDFEAKALSPTQMVSNYQSAGKTHVTPTITFKFAINGDDNEMVSGNDHLFHVLADGEAIETPVITFGEHFVDERPVPKGKILNKDQSLTIRLDMSNVLKNFEEKGYYETFEGKKIYQEDFKGVYVAGGSAPMTWDFDNLINHPDLKLKDDDGDGIYAIDLVLNPSEDKSRTASSWSLSNDISEYPEYSSETVLIDALYNMSLEEMLLDTESDGTFRTGKEWAGVWTRDISYSILLSMAILQPEVSKRSLLRKVKDGVIVQDTGTGGAYPVSTDRIVWGIAAWEIYLITGDKTWLEKVYPIIKKSVEQDLITAYDDSTGLVRGESSFLDWREQTYPAWMQPVDIYSSLNLGTNAVHCEANRVLAQMAQEIGEDKLAKKHQNLAEEIKDAINEKLWIDEKGHYGQYLYGRNYLTLSPRSEGLGEALTVLFGIADKARAKTVVANAPVIDFGLPSIFPNIPNIPPYHNNGIWPFVQAYWTLAAAKVGNEQAVKHSLDALYRPAALFLTNKENFVAETGDYADTQINSDRQLWSVAGNLGMVYKLFFGMEFKKDQLVFKPYVPKAYAGEKMLRHFKYRNAELDISLEGFGNQIASFQLDGKKMDRPSISGSLTGKHEVKIVLSDNKATPQKINLVNNQFGPEVPNVILEGSRLQWQAVEGAKGYKVLGNGQVLGSTKTTSWEIIPKHYMEYQVIAIDVNDWESFASEPVAVFRTGEQFKIELEGNPDQMGIPAKDFSGKGYTEISRVLNRQLPIHVVIPEKGVYALDFRYTNGNGPINTENKAAMRTIYLGDSLLGTVVFPQRGKGNWSDWGFSNVVKAELKAGSHTVRLDFDPANENMNGTVNQALLDYLRITKLD